MLRGAASLSTSQVLDLKPGSAAHYVFPLKLPKLSASPLPYLVKEDVILPTSEVGEFKKLIYATCLE